MNLEYINREGYVAVGGTHILTISLAVIAKGSTRVALGAYDSVLILLYECYVTMVT